MDVGKYHLPYTVYWSLWLVHIHTRVDKHHQTYKLDPISDSQFSAEPVSIY